MSRKNKLANLETVNPADVAALPVDITIANPADSGTETTSNGKPRKYAGRGSKIAFCNYLKRSDVTDVQFATTYKRIVSAGGSVADVAKALNWPNVDASSEFGDSDLSRVRRRAAALRKRGANLPETGRGGGKRVYDIDAVNAALADLPETTN